MVNKHRSWKNKPHYIRVVGKVEAGTGVVDGAKNYQYEECTIDGPSSAKYEPIAPTKPNLSSLPLELVEVILSYIDNKFNLLLVNKFWYAVTLPHVYREPILSYKNFTLFLSIICSNQVVCSLVRSLDLYNIMQVGKNSMLSRLIRRCSPNLESFTAPHSRFGCAPMMSLSFCKQLTTLDLTLVTATLDLSKVFTLIKNFHYLEAVFFPRFSTEYDANAEIQWPPNLKRLGIAGGFSDQFFNCSSLPLSLIELRIQHCPHLTTKGFNNFLERVGRQLERLIVLYPVPHLSSTALDLVLINCRNLLSLEASINYISSAAFDPDLMVPDHPLQELSLHSSGVLGHIGKIMPVHLLVATEMLEDLKILKICQSFGWNQVDISYQGLCEILEERGGYLEQIRCTT